MHKGQTHIQSVIYILCGSEIEAKFAQGVQVHLLEWNAALLLKEEETKVNISQYLNAAW